eukprot:gnl/TRDRNA2_/TRDRNA2_128462_c0_seq1.p1 gnl/TRDRNA2_/TRDRNA2_128462_c0~~gnl/TRDRNA2_/TRDRNA2_128462_c0_seq1.p1  ORF type:complete len:261 (-),score=10.43 gnl/TRDRNA2_/TRDRNA2_128462_c0_seq1:507-1289(-)
MNGEVGSIEVFTPCRRKLPEHCDFVLLVDSLAYTKGSKCRCYMTELLEHFQKHHNWFGIAVMARGVGFVSQNTWGREWSTTYKEMMSKVPKTHLLLLETAGNDFLTSPATICKYYPATLDLGVQQWVAMARFVSKVQMTVCGACASVWGYESPQDSLFDSHVDRLRRVIHAERVHTISGTNELLGIEIKDKCGHIAPAGLDQVFDAWIKWVEFGMRLRPEDLPAPLQPNITTQQASMKCARRRPRSEHDGPGAEQGGSAM